MECGRGASGDEHLAANATTTPTVLLDGFYTRLLRGCAGGYCALFNLSRFGFYVVGSSVDEAKAVL